MDIGWKEVQMSGNEKWQMSGFHSLTAPQSLWA